MNTDLQSRINQWLNDTSQKLDISYLKLKKWPDALKGKENLIIELDCSGNQLKSIPSLHSLTWINCYNNELKSLPSLPKLTYLYCSHNQLESIPTLPNLTSLTCHNNQLESIPSLPNLTTLSCSENKLFSNDLEDWKKIWPLQRTYINSLRELREAGIKRFIKILKLRLYLPRLTQLYRELTFSPYHPGKFYKGLRLGKWSK